MEYTCTKFGVDSSSRFTVTARTNRHTEMQLKALPMPAAMPVAGVGNNNNGNKNKCFMAIIQVNQKRPNLGGMTQVASWIF